MENPNTAPNALAEPCVGLLHKLRLQGERVESLEIDVRAYQELAYAGLAVVADLTKERDRLRTQIQILREEFAQFRARVMFSAGVAA